MNYSLQSSNRLPLTIPADKEYSPDFLLVSAAEKYRITCAPEQRWKDARWSSGPNGFFNMLAWIAGLRVKGVRCFCLCGAYDKEDKTGFRIGTSAVIDVPAGRTTLYFFPNDTRGYYHNNHGQMRIDVERLA